MCSLENGEDGEDGEQRNFLHVLQISWSVFYVGAEHKGEESPLNMAHRAAEALWGTHSQYVEDNRSFFKTHYKTFVLMC